MFKVYSVFDNVSERSVFVTMNHNDKDAIRDFSEGIKRVKERAHCLELLYIGTFDPSSLKITGVDTPVLIAEGIQFVDECEV